MTAEQFDSLKEGDLIRIKGKKDDYILVGKWFDENRIKYAQRYLFLKPIVKNQYIPKGVTVFTTWLRLPFYKPEENVFPYSYKFATKSPKRVKVKKLR